MREIRLSGSEGGGAKPIVSPYPYPGFHTVSLVKAGCIQALIVFSASFTPISDSGVILWRWILILARRFPRNQLVAKRDSSSDGCTMSVIAGVITSSAGSGGALNRNSDPST